MTRFLSTAVAVLALGVLAGAARADDKNPTGTWKYKVEQGGQTREVTLKLKLDGEKLTGALVGRNNTETAIENATCKDGEVSFTVTRTRGDAKIVTKYTGKVSGDTFKGKTESEVNGQKRETTFEAKKEK